MTASVPPPITARSIFATVRAALESQPWCAEIRDRFPAPIATELAQLLDMLAQGIDAGGLLMQVRDVAEVLLKTLTVIAAADLIAHGGPDGAILARRTLFSGRLLLGTWKAGFTSLAAAPRAGLLAPELLDLANPRHRFIKAMDTYIEQRNSDIGHGAYRPDSIDLARRVRGQLLGKYDEEQERYAGGLDRAFASVADTGLWRDAAIHCDSPDGPLFSGATAMHGLRDAPHAHHGATRKLFFVRNGRALDLAPFLAGRICAECGHRDAFLFDSARSLKPKDDPRFDFLDYANGHKLNVNARKTEPALAALADIPFADITFTASKADKGGEFGGPDVVRLLDDIMFDSRFLSPDWLRTPLRRHLEQHRKGIFWLQAEGHVGKTIFVRGLWGEGLGEKERDRQRELLGKDISIAVVPLLLKREYRFDVAQFANVLETQARRTLRMDSRLRLTLPTAGSPADLQAGFVAFAQAALGACYADRLIIAIDGLDELRDPAGQSSVIDYIPPADALPADVTLLLTSRPVAGCPPWLRGRLGRDFAPGREAHPVELTDPGYRALLRDYIARHSGITPADADFETVCETILSRSGALFLIVSFLCDLIRDGASTDAAAAFPEPAA